MNNLRSICFVYGKKDAYNACYLKEFFKWIGLLKLSQNAGL